MSVTITAPPNDDLTFLVACKMNESMMMMKMTNESSSPTDFFVKTLQTLAPALNMPWELIQQRLAWEHVRQYTSGVNVPSTRHHIYLLTKRHCPDEVGHLPERLAGLSATQLLDVLVLLDEAFGGSGQAASCVGDGFREVLLRNSVLERENAELSMQLRSIREKPKAQQNEAAFLVAELQTKLYEALGTMQNMMTAVATRSKKEPRNVSCQAGEAAPNWSSSSAGGSSHSPPLPAAATITTTMMKCDHPKLIAELQQKLEQSLQREVKAKQEMLSRISQYSTLTNSLLLDSQNNKRGGAAANDFPLEGCKHASTQTDTDAQVTRLQRERRLLLERLASATEFLKGSSNNNNSKSNHPSSGFSRR